MRTEDCDRISKLKWLWHLVTDARQRDERARSGNRSIRDTQLCAAEARLAWANVRMLEKLWNIRRPRNRPD